MSFDLLTPFIPKIWEKFKPRISEFVNSIFEEPMKDEKSVILRNVNGKIAVFTIKTEGNSFSICEKITGNLSDYIDLMVTEMLENQNKN